MGFKRIFSSRKRRNCASGLILWMILIYLTYKEVFRDKITSSGSPSTRCRPSPPYRNPNPNNRLPNVLVGDTLSGYLNRVKTDPYLLNKALEQTFLHNKSREIIRCYLTGEKYGGFSSELSSTKESLKTNYDISADVIVFLHIQKTGGTFFNHRLFAQRNLLPFPCTCKLPAVPCTCRPPSGNVWMYSARFAGWPCGLHADWTQLHRCIPDMVEKTEGIQRKRRYFYITQLRDPVRRYLSEWGHQYKGQHWQDAILGCGDGLADWKDIRPCFHGNSWRGVQLDDFMECPHNLATNRQARMLADLTVTNCYRNYEDASMKIKRAHSWVTTAIDNLKTMEYFGLLEELQMSDKLFQKTFGIQFKAYSNNATANRQELPITEQQFLKSIQLAELDIHVYMFAKELLYQRFHI